MIVKCLIDLILVNLNCSNGGTCKNVDYKILSQFCRIEHKLLKYYYGKCPFKSDSNWNCWQQKITYFIDLSKITDKGL